MADEQASSDPRHAKLSRPHGRLFHARWIMVDGISGLVIAFAVVAGFYFWLKGMWAYLKAVANRRPGVSCYRAWRWPSEFVFTRTLPEDLFTEEGQYWVNKSMRSFAQFMIAWLAGFSVGLISRFMESMG